MLKTFILSMIATAASLSSTPAFAQGGSVGGGADDRPTLQAFFTSNDPNRAVKACMEIGSNFGVEASQIQAMVLRSFDKWATYYKSIGGLLTPGTQERVCGIDGEDRTSYRIATRIEFLAKCDGTQDLTLYFGVEIPQIPRSTMGYHTAFADANLYDPLKPGTNQAAWSKGYIWVAPPATLVPSFAVPTWTAYEGAALEYTLLHEFGHVFGNDHVDGTVMLSDIRIFLSKHTQYAVRDRTRKDFDGRLEIDQSRFLSFAPEAKIEANMRVPVAPCIAGDENCARAMAPAYQQSFAYLTSFGSDVGLQLRDYEFEAMLTKPGTSLLPWNDGDAFLSAVLPSKLLLFGNGTTLEFTFNPLNVGNSAIQDTFKHACRRAVHRQAIVNGYLVDARGRQKLMSLQFNWGPSKITLVDPSMPSNDPYCVKYSSIKNSCVLLKSED